MKHTPRQIRIKVAIAVLAMGIPAAGATSTVNRPVTPHPVIIAMHLGDTGIE